MTDENEIKAVSVLVRRKAFKHIVNEELDIHRSKFRLNGYQIDLPVSVAGLGGYSSREAQHQLDEQSLCGDLETYSNDLGIGKFGGHIQTPVRISR
jgi:hypothetical protein